MPTSPRTPADAGAAFHEAISQHRQGHLQQASVLCEHVLQADPRHAAAWHLRGLIALHGPDPNQGVEWIEHSLQLDANQPAAHANIGNFLLTRNQPHLALGRFERALQLKADYPLALYNRGNALSSLGRFAEALASYDQALRLRSDWSTQNNRGLALRKLGRLKEAAAAFASAIALEGQAHDARNNLGATYIELERPRDAVECMQQACRLAPTQPDCWSGLGNAWLLLQRPQEALEAYSQALRLRPEHVDALCGRCAAAVALQQPAAALLDAELALSLGKPSATLLNNLGNALTQLERGAEALARYEEALRIDPVSTDALYNRASMLRNLARPEEAERACAQLLRIAPLHRYVFGLLFQLRMDVCDWREYDEMLPRLLDRNAEHRDIVNPMTLLLLDSPAVQRRGAERFAVERCPVFDVEPPPPAAIEPRRIRIAYLSAAFREHPVSYLLVGVLEQHDRSRFEVFGISLAPAESSDFGQRVRSAFDSILDVQHQSDEQIAVILRALEIDIAVDLMGVTQGARPGIFARRAAPLQVSYLGFAGTTASPHLDYLIADAVSLPKDQTEFYSERVVWLAQCFLPNDDRRAIAAAPSRAACGLPETGMVFCAFANSCKINPPLFEAWMQVLREVPGSILWLRAAGAHTQENLVREARRRNVSPERLVFAARIDSMPEHLARLSCADLFLDTTPYNAHSTACDALWAGVPVVTCKGRTLASRIAASALHSVGLPQLAAENLSDYRDLIVRLARQPTELREVSARLRGARLESPLFQTAKFTRHLERAFETMQQQRMRGTAPANFSLDQRPPVNSSTSIGSGGRPDL